MARFSPFQRLLVATGASSFGDGVRWIVMPLIATQLTSDPRLIAGVFVVDRLPWLLFLLPGGALADRCDRLRLRVAADGFRAVLGAAFVLFAATGHVNLAVVYAVTALMASADAFVDSSSMALVPSLVDEHDLERAGGHLEATEIVTRDLAGPALGGVLFSIGLVAPLAVDAVSFAVSAAVAVTIRGSFRAAPAMPTGTDAGTGAGSALKEMARSIRAGMVWLWREPTLRPLACLSTGMGLVSMMFMAVLVIFATDDLGLGARGYGLLMIPLSIGALLGSWVAPRLHRLPFATAVGGAVIVTGCAVILISRTSAISIVAVLLVFDAAGIIVWNVLTIAFRQRTIPDEMLGRVGAGYRFLLSIGTPVGALLGGVLTSAVGARATLGLTGVATCIAGAAAIGVLGSSAAKSRRTAPRTVPA